MALQHLSGYVHCRRSHGYKTTSTAHCIPFDARRMPSWTATAFIKEHEWWWLAMMQPTHTSSTQGNLKNSLRLSSSCLTVIPSLGPLPKIVSKSRDCDSSHVWMKWAGSSAKDCKKFFFKCELCRDWARSAIYMTFRGWTTWSGLDDTVPLHPFLLMP